MSRGPIPDKSADRPKVPEVLEMARAYYEKPGNEAGGNLHVVLDDGNLDDGCVEGSLDRARENGDLAGAELAEALLAMAGTQRRRIYASL